ncbi:MAG: YlxR family protein [Bacilli bacterium]|nr:YlxR family protein [Bacilli bacterium]
MKTRKVPLRMCAVTRERFEKKELLRVVRNNNGEVFVDDTLKANGRGVYLKKDIDVIEKAQKGKLLDKHLEVSVGDEIYELLKTKI